MEGKRLSESMEGSDQKPPQTVKNWWEDDDLVKFDTMMTDTSFGRYISSGLAMSDSCEVLNTRQKQVHQDPFHPFPDIWPQLQLQQDPFAWTPIPDNEQQLQVIKRPSSWTLELQRRFMDAVNALGGPDRATPKATWKLINGSGYLPTNILDVKLQLQKYRRVRDTSLSNEISRRNYSSSIMVKDIKRRIHSLVVHSCYSPKENFVCVISCGGNEQDPKETIFIDDILNELQKLAVIALRYDLVTDKKTMFGRLNALYGVFILVFSKGYTSPQSLDQLVILMEYKKANCLLVIPVFNNVTPSEVRDPKAFIEETFLKLDTSVHAERVPKWREAIIGLALTDDFKWIGRNEFILPKEIARYACLRLYSISSNNVTGMYSLLNTWPPTDMQIIGIWGMPGVGKTTVAGEIFRRLAPGYDSCYFLQDFHLMYQTKGLSHLRDDFFSKLYGEEKLVDACDTNPSFLKDRFRSKSVLVVIDDASNARDVEALVGGFDWFSCGHLIIFTSRNKQVLVQCKVKKLYQIQKLSESESSQFLSLCVPGQYEPMLNAELVRYASGIPLVLSVLGSCVTNQCTFSENEQLKTLHQNPPTEIQDAFRRSFDGLNENEKNILLDLASFFRGENRNHVIQILDGCGYFTELGICGLLDESLIDPIGIRIEMSNLVQDMGRFSVCEESKEPGKRSRLWDTNEIVEVLTNNSGTEAVEGIFLDMSNLTCELSPTIFERTYRLRLLKLHCSISGNHCNLCLPRGLYSLPDELRLRPTPLGILPSEILATKL